MDGFLYIALGDGGRSRDRGDGHGDIGNGQNPSTFHGSILRIDVSPEAGQVGGLNNEYAVPETNPFVGTVGAAPEVYAYGFRNPFRIGFDPETGDLYAGDVGEGSIEEINLVLPGRNYGWVIKEGTFYFERDSANLYVDPPDGVDPTLYTDPIAQYDHDEGRAIIGGAVYRGESVPAMTGYYVCGEYVGARMFYLDDAGDLLEAQVETPLPLDELFLKGFSTDGQGEFYVTLGGSAGTNATDGRVMRLVAPNASAEGENQEEGEPGGEGEGESAVEGEDLTEGEDVSEGEDKPNALLGCGGASQGGPSGLGMAAGALAAALFLGLARRRQAR